MLLLTVVSASRILSTVSCYKFTSWLIPPVLGSRAWTWAIVAPALAALIADSAISFGVTGTCGLLLVVSPAPVTAHDKITLLLMMISSYCFLWYVFKNLATFEKFNYTADPIEVFFPFI